MSRRLKRDKLSVTPIVCDSPIARHSRVESCGKPATHFYHESDGLSARCSDHALSHNIIKEIDEETYRVAQVMES